MRELTVNEVEQVGGASYTTLIETGGALIAALSDNPYVSAFAGGFAFGTAINQTFGTQISNAIWDVTHW